MVDRQWLRQRRRRWRARVLPEQQRSRVRARYALYPERARLGLLRHELWLSRSGPEERRPRRSGEPCGSRGDRHHGVFGRRGAGPEAPDREVLRLQRRYDRFATNYQRRPRWLRRQERSAALSQLSWRAVFAEWETEHRRHRHEVQLPGVRPSELPLYQRARFHQVDATG